VTAAYRVSRDAGATTADQGLCVYVAALPAGPLVVLEGTAALIWGEATAEPAAGWVGRVADAVGRPEADIAADVEAFALDLCERGLLERVEAAGRAD
jgi:hypothetical protein